MKKCILSLLRVWKLLSGTFHFHRNPGIGRALLLSGQGFTRNPFTFRGSSQGIPTKLYSTTIISTFCGSTFSGLAIGRLFLLNACWPAAQGKLLMKSAPPSYMYWNTWNSLWSVQIPFFLQLAFIHNSFQSSNSAWLLKGILTNNVARAQEVFIRVAAHRS